MESLYAGWSYGCPELTKDGVVERLRVLCAGGVLCLGILRPLPRKHGIAAKIDVKLPMRG